MNANHLSPGETMRLAAAVVLRAGSKHRSEAAWLEDAAVEADLDSVQLHPALMPYARWRKALAVACVILEDADS